MTGKNKYFRRSKISEAKFRQLLRLFAMDLTATDTAQLCNLSVRSVNAIYQRIRVRLAQECATQSPFSGTLEADESYFGPKRVRGKRGRGAGGAAGAEQGGQPPQVQRAHGQLPSLLHRLHDWGRWRAVHFPVAVERLCQTSPRRR